MPEYVQHNAQGIITNKWYSVDSSVVSGLQNIIKVDRNIFNQLTEYWIVDSGSVREMTQQEKDQWDAYKQQQAEQAETDRLNALDGLIESGVLQGIALAKVDNAIDNIGSLNDAKAFLKKLCRFVLKFIAGSSA